MIPVSNLPVYTNQDYFFNFSNFDLHEMMSLGYLALNEKEDNILIADRIETCPSNKVKGYYIDVLNNTYVLRELEAKDNLEDTEVASWMIIKREAFEKQTIKTPFFRFTF